MASEWLKVSGDLKTYSGLANYCKSKVYREKVFDLLHQVHSYDSMILTKISDPAIPEVQDNKEVKGTLKDLEKLETKYSLQNFIAELKKTCEFRSDIEKGKDKQGFADDTYDGQILVLETELRRYLNHIDDLVLKMDDHLHILHLKNK